MLRSQRCAAIGRAGAAVAIMAASAVAACGTPATSVSSLPAAHTPAPAGTLLKGRFSVYEAERLDGTFEVPPPEVVQGGGSTPTPTLSCATYAAGHAGSFAAPVFDTTVGNYAIYFQLLFAKGYRGPGAYSAAAKSAANGTLALNIGVALGTQSGAVSIFRSRIGGTTTLTVKPDGSGSVDFADWGSDEVRGDTGSAAHISGTVSWTCG